NAERRQAETSLGQLPGGKLRQRLKFILGEVHTRDEPLLRSVASSRKLLSKLKLGHSAAVTLFSQAKTRTLNVVIGNAPNFDHRRRAGKLSENKTAFALDPGIFLVGHILIVAHNWGSLRTPSRRFWSPDVGLGKTGHLAKILTWLG